MAVDNGIHALLVKAQRSCKANGRGCVQVKVADPAPGEQRRGCITQITPEEITALQFSVLDMGRFGYFDIFQFQCCNFVKCLKSFPINSQLLNENRQ